MFNGNMLIGTIEFGNNGAFNQLNWGKHENLWNILGYSGIYNQQTWRTYDDNSIYWDYHWVIQQIPEAKGHLNGNIIEPYLVGGLEHFSIYWE